MSALGRLAGAPALMLLGLLVLPLVGLVSGARPHEIMAALALPSTRAALGLTLWTTTVALAFTVALGTPLAWRLSRERSRVLTLLVELPVVLPPAVLGVALLETFGARGLLGPALQAVGLRLPFTPAAVVMAQVLVGAPLYVLTGAAAFRAVDDDLILVARTLGAGPLRAWTSVALPAAAGGLLAGAGLAWARALGEFGATLMFAGNLPGRTQTLTLAIFQALEGDLAQARAISLVLMAAAVAVLVALRGLGGARP